MREKSRIPPISQKMQNRYYVLGAVYTCDFAYESPYDSVYDLLPKGSSKLVFDLCLMKCVYRPLQCMLDEELVPYSVSLQIVHRIVRRFVRRFGHV
jgi:hypothetical protein